MSVRETGTGPGRRDAETIRLNNCDGKAPASQAATREQQVQLNTGGQVGASGGVVSAAVSGNYGQMAGAAKSLQLTAPPGTNMEFNIEWKMEERIGTVSGATLGANSAEYHLFRPMDVQIASQKDLGCGVAQVTQSSQPTPPTSVTASSMKPSNPPVSPTTAPTNTLQPPTKTPLPTNTPPPPTQALTPTPAPKPGDVLYRAEWPDGTNDWGEPGGWGFIPTDKTLIYDGSGASTILAPYRPGDHKIVNYAVEAEIRTPRGNCGHYFLVARSGYKAGVYYHQCYGNNWKAMITTDDDPRFDNNSLITEWFWNPGADWHVYRFEVQGPRLEFYFDGKKITGVDNTGFREGGQVGIRVYYVPLELRSFKIIAR